MNFDCTSRLLNFFEGGSTLENPFWCHEGNPSNQTVHFTSNLSSKIIKFVLLKTYILLYKLYIVTVSLVFSFTLKLLHEQITCCL